KDDRVYMQYLNGEPVEVFFFFVNQFIRREYSSKFRFELNKETGTTDLMFGVNNERVNIRNRMTNKEHVPLELLMKGDLIQAEEAYKVLIMNNPDFSGEAERNILVYAGELDKSNSPIKAVNAMKMSVRLFPESINSIGSLALYFKEKGNKSEALKALKKALEIKPDDEKALEALKQLSQDTP
ncbi:MAG: tetratricopeptide repeat protein, partial [Marinicellaceae bacterium]